MRKAVLRVIKEQNRFLHIKEIVPILHNEGYYSDVDESQVSRTLTGLKSGNNPYRLITHRVGLMANTFWGYESFYENGFIKDVHMYNESIVTNERKRRTNEYI